jgi:hypothetical protein
LLLFTLAVQDVEEIVSLAFELSMKGIGLSLIDASPKEMLFLSMQNMELSFSQSNIDQKIQLKLGNLQVFLNH